jgi:hypothetical protein
MTLDGVLYLLPTPAPPTGELESSSLPTPLAGDWKNAYLDRGRNKKESSYGDLPRTVAQLPTPTARDYKEQNIGWTWQRDGVTQEDTLPRALTALLPTPRVSDTNGAGVHGNGGPDLRTAMSLLPTPNATDVDKHAGQPRHKREGHQPRIGDVIEYLDQWNGESTSPPSDDGSSSPGPRPRQPSTGDHDSDSTLPLWNG